MLRSKHVLFLSDLPCLLIVPCISPCITYLTVILFVYLIPFLVLFSLSSLSFLLRVCIPASFTSHSFAPWKLSINLPTFLVSSLLPRTQAWYEGDFDPSPHHGLDVGLCLLGHREGVCRLPVYLCLIKFLPRGLHISRPLCTEFWGKQIWHDKTNTYIRQEFVLNQIKVVEFHQLCATPFNKHEHDNDTLHDPNISSVNTVGYL